MTHLGLPDTLTALRDALNGIGGNEPPRKCIGRHLVGSKNSELAGFCNGNQNPIG